MEGTSRTRLRQEPESIARAPTPGPVLASRSSRNRRDEQNTIALLEGARFAAEKANVFFIEVHVEELADLALIVADVAREVGKAGCSSLRASAIVAAVQSTFGAP